MFPKKKQKGDNMEPKIIGERIKNLIKEKKVTKEYVAKRIGITNKKLENKLEGKEEFLHAGGENFHYVPCLNDEDRWIEVVKQLCEEEL